MLTGSRRTLGALAVLLLATDGSGASVPAIRFTESRLPNGLRLVVCEDHMAPVASVALIYNVGHRDERPGHTGMAHLFEHLMFSGSANVAPGDHARLVNLVGGRSAANALPDRTQFSATVPANQLELVLFLEADRMRSLNLTTERLEMEKKVVAEERRMRLDNREWGRTFQTVSELAYQGFAYAHPGAGTMEDVARTTLDDARAFFNKYYAPNNAVLAVVGDVDPGRTAALVRKYFGDIPARPSPEPPDTTEPPQTTERRRTLVDPLASLSRLDILWHIPPVTHPDSEPLLVLATILAEGRTSRLHQALITDVPMASRVFAHADESRDTGLFSVMLTFPPSTGVDKIESATYRAIERLHVEAVQPWELDKAKKQALLFLMQHHLRSAQSRGLLLATAAVVHGSAGAINRRLERIESVTANDVQRVAKRYLQSTRRSVVATLPKSAAPPSGREVGR